MVALFYQDLKLLHDQDVSSNFLMSKVMSVLHLKFCSLAYENGHVDVGIAFPGYDSLSVSLGNIIRLFSWKRDSLESVSMDRDLRKFYDYIKVNDIKETPYNCCNYVKYQRIQFNGNRGHQIRRYAKRHNISEYDASQLYKSYKPAKAELPYVILNSNSNGHRFRLYVKEIQYSNYTDENIIFNNYGLTVGGVLPTF